MSIDSDSVDKGKSGRGGDRPIGILLADDEPIIRATIRRGLIRRGFAVWVCADGREAVNLYRKHASEIDVVLLDVHMPHLDGSAASVELRGIDSTIRLCFMTGDSTESTRSRLVGLGARFIFSKPFSSVGDLSDTLARIASDQGDVMAQLETTGDCHDSLKSPKSVPRKPAKLGLPDVILRLIQRPVHQRSSPAKQRDSCQEAD